MPKWKGAAIIYSLKSVAGMPWPCWRAPCRLGRHNHQVNGSCSSAQRSPLQMSDPCDEFEVDARIRFKIHNYCWNCAAFYHVPFMWGMWLHLEVSGACHLGASHCADDWNKVSDWTYITRWKFTTCHFKAKPVRPVFVWVGVIWRMIVAPFKCGQMFWFLLYSLKPLYILTSQRTYVQVHFAVEPR